MTKLRTSLKSRTLPKLLLLAPLVVAAQISFADDVADEYAAAELRETYTEIFGAEMTDLYSDAELNEQGYSLLVTHLDDGAALLVSRVSAAIAIQEVTADPIPDGLFESLMDYSLASAVADEQLEALELLAGQGHPSSLMYLELFLNQEDDAVRTETMYQLSGLADDATAYDLLLNQALMYPERITDLLISELASTDTEIDADSE